MTAEELKFGSDGLGTEKCSQQSPGSKLIFSKASLTEFGCPHANVFMLLSETSLTPLIVPSYWYFSLQWVGWGCFASHSANCYLCLVILICCAPDTKNF